MLCVGVDFGSTYSIVSVYRSASRQLETMTLSEGADPFIPSVLALGNGTAFIGDKAKQKLYSKNVKSYRAFKMLLTEDSPELLREWGYSEEFPPKEAVRQFLHTLLETLLIREGLTAIDRLVVGIPEVWNNALQTVDGKALLRQICEGFPFLCQEDAKVQIVSEPAAASAYYCYKYREERRKSALKAAEENFTGKILLIDYGGGTLDITLTDVETRVDRSGRSAMEIRVLKRAGAGENEDKQLGKAGIAYMDAVMKAAIAQVMPGVPVEHDSAFLRAVDELERCLKSNDDTHNDIRTIFTNYGYHSPEDLSEEMMDEDDFYFIGEDIIYYKGQSIPVSYQLLAQVYEDTIQGVLDQTLDEVIRYMDSHNIPYADNNAQNFKLAVVGGFGNFYLVQNQVEKKFKVNSLDRRLEPWFRSAKLREMAISMGTALLAAGEIRIRNTAPYSIGVCSRSATPEGVTYGLTINQDVGFEDEYFQRDRQGNFVVMLSGSGAIERFAINLSEEPNRVRFLQPRKEFREKLSEAFAGHPCGVVSFSIDACGVITLHIYDYDIFKDTLGKKLRSIELTSFRELFDGLR